MIDISIIIVNYNVRYFIEQCIHSVYRASDGLNIEVIVVDNNSVDNSVPVIKEKFPDVKLIENKKNVGFAKANNQAIKIAKGKYILLLNPDTLVEEDTLRVSYKYMEKHADTGTLGVKLIDGNGEFLPESKRSLPTLASSFYRFVGLSKLFPKSKVFNSYNLGNLDENETNEVDVLCGAFMFIRASIIKEVGYLDEAFFMYGEDIDYSYRIQKAGYKVIYLPETKIIHFKGESTKKSSLKYHNIFYKAMAIFAKKHYGGKRFNPILWFINISVVLLATTSYIKRKLSDIILPILDIFTIVSVMYLIESFWANYHFKNPGYYDTNITILWYLLYGIIISLNIYLYGGYKNKWVSNSIKGLGLGTIIILIIYALLPENIRFSRAVILMGMIANFIALFLLRILLRSIFPSIFTKYETEKNILFVGSKQEVDRAKRIMNINGIVYKDVGTLTPETSKSNGNADDDTMYGLEKIDAVLKTLNVDEIIFCTGHLEISKVIGYMEKFRSNVKIKILPKESLSIIGSSGRNSQGEFYDLDQKYKLENKNLLRAKYIVDFITALTLLILFPLVWIFIKKIKFGDIISVLTSNKTWVSYIQDDDKLDNLPKLKKGIFTPNFNGKPENLSQDEKSQINANYAKNFSIWNDLENIFTK